MINFPDSPTPGVTTVTQGSKTWQCIGLDAGGRGIWDLTSTPDVAAAAVLTDRVAAQASAIASAASAAAAAGTLSAVASAAALAGAYPVSAASNVPRGLTQASVGAITPGATGTNGTFALAFSAGTGWLTYPTGTFTVAGGVLTAVTITGPGLCISAAPVVPTVSFAASAGLAGAAVALTMQFLVTAGQSYWVQSTDAKTLSSYQNVAGVATANTGVGPIFTQSGMTYVVDELAYKEKRQRELPLQLSYRPKLAIVVSLGQSLAITRATPVVQSKAFGSSRCFMPVGGPCVVDFDFFPTNATFTMHWNELASMVEHNEPTLGSHMPGIANMLVGGKYAQVWQCSAAIGARTLEVLMTTGPCNNLWGILQRMCDLARTAGYDPEVVFYVAHGEANAAVATTEQAYLDLGMEYFPRAQLYAAQAMRRPGYVAPIFFTTMASGTLAGMTYSEVRRAIHRLARDLPGGVLLGGIYQWPTESDRTHPTAAGFILRGEFVGKAIRDYVERGVRQSCPQIIDVILSGTTATVVYDRPMQQRLTGGYAAWANVGSNLSTALAEEGWEWFDNSSQIAVNAVAYNGPKVTLTLASAPVGTLVQQAVRYGEQTITGALQANANNLPGGPLCSQEAGWASMYDPTYTNFVWAPPQTFTSVRA